jgi:hypothetical protein
MCSAKPKILTTWLFIKKFANFLKRQVGKVSPEAECSPLWREEQTNHRTTAGIGNDI